MASSVGRRVPLGAHTSSWRAIASAATSRTIATIPRCTITPMPTRPPRATRSTSIWSIPPIRQSPYPYWSPSPTATALPQPTTVNSPMPTSISVCICHISGVPSTTASLRALRLSALPGRFATIRSIATGDRANIRVAPTRVSEPLRSIPMRPAR